MPKNEEEFNDIKIISTKEQLESKILPVNVNGWEAGKPLEFLTIADVHIGALRGPLSDKHALARSEAALTELLNVIDEQKPQVLFILGDIFHFKKVTKDEEEVFNRFLGEALNRCLVIMHPGNHDYFARGKSNIQYLQTLYDADLLSNFYITSIESQLLNLTNGTDSIKVLNHPCEISLDLQEIEWANIVCYHGDVRGAVFDNGYDPTTDENYVDIRVKLPYKKADLFLLGDIHMRQWLSDNAVYSGSMYQTKSSETPDKGYMKGSFWFEEGKPSFKLVHENLTSPYPLMTITVNEEKDWPKDWPTNCWIQLKYNSNLDLSSCSFPLNIYAYSPSGTKKFKGFSDASEMGEGAESMEFLNDPYFEVAPLLKKQEEVYLDGDSIIKDVELELEDIRSKL